MEESSSAYNEKPLLPKIGESQIRSKPIFHNEADFDEWWAKLDTKIEKKSFCEHEEDIFKYSVILKSFRNEYETDSLIDESTRNLLLKGRIPLKSKSKSPAEILIPGYNPNSFIPNTSALTHREMFVCQTVLQTGLPKNSNQSNIWAMCKPKLDEEQEEYIDFARVQWITDGFKKHALIKSHIKEMVDLFWKVRLERVNLFPKFYGEKENISLALTSSEEVEAKFIKQLESIGRSAKYIIPDLWTFDVNINSMHSLMERPEVGWYMSKKDSFQYYKQIPSKLINAGYHSDVSKDKIADKLAKEKGANIVMSSSAFTNIIDNSFVNNSDWNLPVTVSEYRTERGMKKIAFIDKKLPPISMNAVERNKYYANKALKKLFVRPPDNYRKPEACVYNPDSLETFGIDDPAKKISFSSIKKKRKNKCFYCLKKESLLEKFTRIKTDNEVSQTNNISLSDSEGSSSLCIDLDKSSEIETKEIIETNPSTPVPTSSKDEFQIDDLKVCHCTCEGVEDMGNAATNKKKKLNYEVVYNLWEFCSSESQNYMSKNCSKDLKVIIRTTMEGQNGKSDDHFPTYYKLIPKLEYQPEFGAEVVTLSEVLRDWAKVFIRPSSKLARVRLDGITGELIQIQKLKASEVAAECQRLYKTNPKERLSSLHNILVKLTDLPAGLYMLSFSPKTGTFVKLMQSVERGGNQITNIHLQYNMVKPDEMAPPRSAFLPLDKTLMTPTFTYFKRIPCTFAPKNTREKHSLFKDNSAINPPPPARHSKKKKKKGKQKKIVCKQESL